MIIDSIKNASQYYGISDDIKEALIFLETHPHETEPVRLSEKTSVKILPSDTVPEDSRKWEAHDHLIDIHYILSGTEDICWANRSDLAFQYKEEGKDVLRYEGEGTRFSLTSGMFAIVFPQDVHKTKLAHNGTCEKVLKGIVKISLD